MDSNTGYINTALGIVSICEHNDCDEICEGTDEDKAECAVNDLNWQEYGDE